MGESILDLVGDGDETRRRRARIGGPSAWTPPPPPPPLNFAHLRVVASGDATVQPGTRPMASSEPEGTPRHEAPASPPPPHPLSSSREAALRIRQLEQELAAARDEAEALHQMLEDLPEIFERKFRQRLQAVLEHQQHLLADNQALRDRLFALGPAAPVERPRLPPANEERWGLGRRLRQVLRQQRGA
ncbi:hypothetical protein NZK32_02275 [Cyanobium sp. FGCU-52]|nr:hypothetical protein [Cyanobium sp. FGCU52]